MLALLAAATLAAGSGAAPIASETPNRFVLPEHCRAFQQTNRPKPKVLTGPRRLTELPAADLHLLVDRRVGGCPVPTIVRYGVEDGTGAPTAAAPTRREDAPARRR
jgi:hypothetical protein